MPDDKPPVRSGSYADGTSAQLQGRASNKTAQYLSEISPDHPGQQGFYRAALTGIPHPMQRGQMINYGQLQDLLASPQGAAAREAYATTHQLNRAPSAEQMQAEAFASARQQMLDRGAANPGQLAFGAEADSALRAPLNARNIAHGNYVPLVGGQLSSPLAQAQRYADLPAASVYAAPGMGAMNPRHEATTSRRSGRLSAPARPPGGSRHGRSDGHRAPRRRAPRLSPRPWRR